MLQNTSQVNSQDHQLPVALISWFQKNKRDLPWRKPATVKENPLLPEKILRDPYCVLISEIMLQQTQAAVVVDYFNRFVKKWPTLSALAQASEEEVVKFWEGLGYYSRARALLKGARKIHNEFHGRFPVDLQTLKTIPGIGPYTAGAVLSLAFNQRVSALDANAIRVLTRFFGIALPIEQQATKTQLDQLWMHWSREIDIAQANEALIELGALICKGRQAPLCHQCPLKTDCKAYQEDKVAVIPVKKERAKIETLYRPTLILRHRSGKEINNSSTSFFVRHVHGSQVMQGLYEWPYWEWDEPLCAKTAQVFFEERLECALQKIHPLVPLSHCFTRYKAHLYPFFCEVAGDHDITLVTRKLKLLFNEPGKSLRVLDSDRMKAIPFCSGHKMLFKRVIHCQDGL